MPRVLIASDSAALRDEIRGSLLAPDTDVVEVDRGANVLEAVNETEPDVVVLDLQIGNMGAAAVCRNLRHEEEAGRRPRRLPVVFLLDRGPDSFLARRADADAWLEKPIRPRALSKTFDILLAGDTWTPSAISTALPDEVPLETEGSAAEGIGGDSEAIRTGSPSPDSG